MYSAIAKMGAGATTLALKAQGSDSQASPTHQLWRIDMGATVEHAVNLAHET